jgi:HSP20 family molecular chaperone IbpA
MSLFFPRFNEFSPVFRLADELERATREASNIEAGRSFAPKFDLHETKDAYELHGELPGIEQSDINLEWSDDNSLNISGKREKVRTESSEGNDGGDGGEHSQAANTGNKAVAKKSETAVAKAADGPRYWITERSFGSFNRTFQFPTNVNQEAVKASLKNGVLTVIVPKAKAKEPRKITIE